MLSVSLILRFFLCCHDSFFFFLIDSISTRRKRVRRYDRALLLPLESSQRNWRALCAGTPLRVSTKKYCRDVTIASCGRKTSDDRHKSWTEHDGFYPKTLLRQGYVYILYVPIYILASLFRPKKYSRATSICKKYRTETYRSRIGTYISSDRVINHRW